MFLVLVWSCRCPFLLVDLLADPAASEGQGLFVCIDPAVLLPPPRSAAWSWRFIVVLPQSTGLAAAVGGTRAGSP